MQLRLDNIEQAVEPVIVQRGRKYFRSGCVTECTDTEGDVEAVVEGTERYKVSMQLDADGAVLSHSCTCPYDWGDVCKHEVAVLLYLREQHKAAARKAKVADVMSDLQTQVKRIKAEWSSGEAKEEKKQISEPQNKLADDMFQLLPKDELSRHIMALSLIRNGFIHDGYLARITKASQLTKNEAQKQLKQLCQQGFLERGDYYEEYRLKPMYVLPLAMYILDRHPDWLVAEVTSVRALQNDQKAFWDICRAVYEDDKEALGRCASYEWGFVGSEALVHCFFQPFYEPILQTLPNDALYRAAIKTLNQLELDDLITEERLEKVRHGVDSYHNHTKSPDVFFEDYFAFLRYFSSGALPLVNAYSSEWAYIAHAVSAMHHGQWKKAGMLFDSAHKIRNKKTKDKNLFYDPIANYYLMVYYAKTVTADSLKKAQQFLKKQISGDILQLPASIVAKYIVLQEDDGNLSWNIDRLISSNLPLLKAFARLFADFFHMESTEQPPRLKLLQNEPLLFSLTVKSRWEKALDELMGMMPNQPSEANPAKPKKQERLVYVIQHFGDDIYICPQKQKACKDGSWSKLYNVSAQTYFTKGYDFMDEVDRLIYDHLRKMVNHTKYYYRPNWGTLADYLPFLVDTDKVLFKKSDYDYEPVSVRKERAFLNIERKKNGLSFSSNIRLRKGELTLPQIRIVEETPTSYLVVELSDYERNALGVLLGLGNIPSEAEPRLQQFISAVSNQLEVHWT